METASGRFLAYAARARANPNFDLEEREHRLDIAQRMRGMLEAARDGSLVTQLGVGSVFRGEFGGRPFSLTSPQQNRWLQAWAAADEASLTRALIGFVEGGATAEARFAAFARAAEEVQAGGGLEADAGALLAFGSLFNFAVEPQSQPVISAPLFERLERVLGCELSPEAPVTQQYEHHLELARSLRAQMEQERIPIRDMIDAQSLIWIAAEEHELWASEPGSGAGERGRETGAGGGKASEASYLSVCAIYRDEAPYLREWIEFHRLVGVGRFLLYNDRSNDEHLDVLAPYLEDGTVTLHDWPSVPAGQSPAYEHCLREHGDTSRWIAFIDVDEFLFSPTYRSLPDVLAELERWPGVGVNSVFFGTSGHRTRPEGLVIENYLRNDGAKRSIKSIVDPSRTARPESVHHFAYREGMTVNENGYPIQGNRMKSASHSRLRINHYWAKSEEQFRAKCATPMPATGSFRPWYNMRRLAEGELNEASETILKYAPALRKAVADVAARPGGAGT